MNNQTPASYQPVITDPPSPLKKLAGEIVFWGLVLAALSLIAALISGAMALVLWIVLLQVSHITLLEYWQACFFPILICGIVVLYCVLDGLQKNRKKEEES